MFTGDYLSDCAIMTDYLDEIPYYSGTERKQMLKKAGLKHGKDSGSMLYGYTWKGYLAPGRTRTLKVKGVYQTKIKDDYPELEAIFREFADFHFPDFDWGQVQMNKNYLCPPHKDSANIGESILCTLGDYTGGATVVDYETKQRKYDGKNAPVRFNGSKYTHWVEPYEGTRYALVFFHNKSSRQLNKILYNSNNA